MKQNAYALLPRQYPKPTHTILHLSDLHFVENNRPLYGKVDSDENLSLFLDRFCETEPEVDAIVITGDLADNGTVDSYQRLRSIVESAADRLSCPVAWVMGNHDDRANFRAELLDGSGKESVDHVLEVSGLRLVVLDSTVPGFHHGVIDDSQLSWLTDVLSDESDHGTIVALHHPPIPTELSLLQAVELRESSKLAECIHGTDVRAILAGHFHYPTTSLLSGVPVFAAAATCYTQDLSVPWGVARGQDAGQGANLVHIYPDRVVSSGLTLSAGSSVYQVGMEDLEKIMSGRGGPDLLGS